MSSASDKLAKTKRVITLARYMTAAFGVFLGGALTFYSSTFSNDYLGNVEDDVNQQVHVLQLTLIIASILSATVKAVPAAALAVIGLLVQVIIYAVAGDARPSAPLIVGQLGVTAAVAVFGLLLCITVNLGKVVRNPRNRKRSTTALGTCRWPLPPKSMGLQNAIVAGTALVVLTAAVWEAADTDDTDVIEDDVGVDDNIAAIGGVLAILASGVLGWTIYQLQTGGK